MARLPVPGSDEGVWGEVLNQFLAAAHNDDGSLKDVGLIASKYTLPTGGVPESDLSSDVQTKINAASDSDTTAIANLSPSNDDLIQRKAGAWTNRTPAQVKADLALAKADVGLTNADDTSDLNKPVSTAQAASIATKPTWLGSGLHASRPVATDGAGLWYSTDINGGTLYYSDDATWSQLSAGVLDSGGQELSYTEINIFPTSGANPWTSQGFFDVQERVFTANTAQTISNFETTWIPTDTRPVEVKVVIPVLSPETDGSVVAVRVMADVGDGSGPVNIGQQNIVAAAADATMRFEISTRLPHGSVTPAVGVAATISVDLFTSANQTISAYAGETPLGNFYPYIQVIRR